MRSAIAPSIVTKEVICRFTFIESKAFVMKIIFTDLSRSVNDSE